MDIVIRADGSTELGYGHLYRSNTIATELVSQGKFIKYLTTTPTEVSSICNSRAEIVSLASSDKMDFVNKLSQLNPDAVLLDLPHAPFDLQQKIRHITQLAVILGSARNKIACDILINGHLYAADEVYTWAGDEPTWCLGPDYHPLRHPFPKIASQQKDYAKQPEKALILMGGTDPHNLTPRAMRSLASFEMDVTAIVGPGNEYQTEIEKVADNLDTNFEVARDPDDLPYRMLKADIAITGVGNTIYELMAAQTPFVGIARTELELEGAMKNKPYIDVDILDKGFSINELEQSIAKLVDSPTKRTTLQQQFENLMDGKGTQRIVKEIKSLG